MRFLDYLEGGQGKMAGVVVLLVTGHLVAAAIVSMVMAPNGKESWRVTQTWLLQHCNNLHTLQHMPLRVTASVLTESVLTEERAD